MVRSAPSFTCPSLTVITASVTYELLYITPGKAMIFSLPSPQYVLLATYQMFAIEIG